MRVAARIAVSLGLMESASEDRINQLITKVGLPAKIGTAALAATEMGAAIAGAVVAGKAAGGYSNYADAQKVMTGLKSRVFKPNPAAHVVYEELYSLYRKLHDAFGTPQATGNLYDVMKKLIEIRMQVRN